MIIGKSVHFFLPGWGEANTRLNLKTPSAPKSVHYLLILGVQYTRNFIRTKKMNLNKFRTCFFTIYNTIRLLKNFLIN